MIFPSNTRSIINDIRNTIGRHIGIHYVSGTYPCPNPDCSLDPTTGLSTNSFCTICSGNYYIPNILVSGLIAHITWGKNFDKSMMPFGIDNDGDVRIQIEYTQDNHYIVSNALFIVADNHKFEIDKYDFRGVPEINRIVIYGRLKDED